MLIPFNAMLGSEGRKPVVPIWHESIKEFIMIPPAEPKCPPIDSLRLLPIVQHSSADNIGCLSTVYVEKVYCVEATYLSKEFKAWSEPAQRESAFASW